MVDISAKATADAKAKVEVEDLIAYERRHGRIPAGLCGHALGPGGQA